jgi:hypothetical protein
MNHHPRPELARELADELQGKKPFSDAPNGLFLSGPRRTGKTQFLRFDLQPELERRGMLVIYADLWANDAQSAVDRLLTPIRTALAANDGPLKKFFTQAGVDKMSVPGMLQIDLTKAGKPDGLPLPQVIEWLSSATSKTIVLIVDEAQEALTSEQGQSAMRALKSARDTLKTPTDSKLLLVMAGSHRDKLMRLLNSAAAPFWGSQVRTLPLLGDDYVHALAGQLKRAKPELATLNAAVLIQAFEHYGRRPQHFFNALQQQVNQAQDGAELAKLVLNQSEQQKHDQRQEFTQIYRALEPLEQAVLQRMLETGEDFKPFNEQALEFYRQRTSSDVNTGQVQAALEAMRTDERRLIWKAHRGEYVVYDQGMNDWAAYLMASRNWPPQ